MKNNRKKITKLTERQLVNLVKKVINEQNENVSALREIHEDFREQIKYRISLIDSQFLDMINYSSSSDEYYQLYREIGMLEEDLSEFLKRLYDIEPLTDELN